MTAPDLQARESNQGEVVDTRTVNVTFQPSGRQFEVTQADSLFEIAAEAGVEVDTVCGGNGSCGKCKVLFEEDPPVACSIDYMHLSGGEIARGYRLSCQVLAKDGMVVRVPKTGNRATVRLQSQLAE